MGNLCLKNRDESKKKGRKKENDTKKNSKRKRLDDLKTKLANKKKHNLDNRKSTTDKNKRIKDGTKEKKAKNDKKGKKTKTGKDKKINKTEKTKDAKKQPDVSKTLNISDGNVVGSNKVLDLNKEIEEQKKREAEKKKKQAERLKRKKAAKARREKAAKIRRKKAAKERKKKETKAKKQEAAAEERRKAAGYDAVFEKYFLKYKDYPDLKDFLMEQYGSKMKTEGKKKKKRPRKKKLKKEKKLLKEETLGKRKPLPPIKGKRFEKPRHRIGSEDLLYAESGRLGLYCMFEMTPEYYGIKKPPTKDYNTQTFESRVYIKVPPPPTFRNFATQTRTYEAEMQTVRKRTIFHREDKSTLTLPFIGSFTVREFPTQTAFNELLRRIYYVDPNAVHSESAFISEDLRFIVPGVIRPFVIPPPPPPKREEKELEIKPTSSEEIIDGEKEIEPTKRRWKKKTKKKGI